MSHSVAIFVCSKFKPKAFLCIENGMTTGIFSIKKIHIGAPNLRYPASALCHL